MSKQKAKPSFLYRNSLSFVLLALTLFSIFGQIITGWHEHNDFLTEHHTATITLLPYLSSGHFIQTTFENWESEFFQMFLFVVFTIFLRQKGSSESKGFEGTEDVDRKPKAHAKAPWPVRKGGFILKLYSNSLSIALLLFFIFSFAMHWYGSCKDYNLQQILEHKPTYGMLAYLTNNRFWFESFQNWQSEFLSVFLLIFLSIYLRQIGSPQSKPVDAPNEETGE